jgi:hypothetical protein
VGAYAACDRGAKHQPSAVCNGLPMQQWLLRTALSLWGKVDPAVTGFTKVVLGGLCHYRAIHSGHDRSRADNHGQRHGALDLRRPPVEERVEGERSCANPPSMHSTNKANDHYRAARRSTRRR